MSESEPVNVRESAAVALWREACRLRESRRDEDEVATLRELLDVIGAEGVPSRPYLVADALYAKSAALGRLGRVTEAVQACDLLVQRFGDVEQLSVREQLARAMWNKCVWLRNPADASSEMAALDELVQRFGDASEATVREPVALALYTKSLALDTAGQRDAAVKVWADIVKRFGDDPVPGEPDVVLEALDRLRHRLTRTGRGVDGLAACEELIARYRESEAQDVRDKVAAAMADRAFLLQPRGPEAELAALDELLLYGDGAEGAFASARVARALARKSELLADMGRTDEAFVVAEAALAHLDDQEDVAFRRDIGQRLIGTIGSLLARERFSEALRLSQGLATQHGDAADPALRRQAVHALHRSVGCLGALGRDDEARAVWRDLIEFGEDAIVAFDEFAAYLAGLPAPGDPRAVAGALLTKAQLLADMDRRDEALTLLDDIGCRFGSDRSPSGNEVTAICAQLRAELSADTDV